MRTARGVFHPVWNQLDQFQGEMNRLFERWTGNEATGNGASLFPALNVWEEDEHLLVEAEVPGLELSALEIYVTGGNQLTLKGERKVHVAERGLWHRQERGHGSFTRTLTLPYLVDPDKVDARLDQGVLRVKLAKHESARPRKIVVKGA